MYEANRSTLARWVLSSDATCALPNPRVGFHRPWAQLVDNCRLASIDARHLCATQAGKGLAHSAKAAPYIVDPPSEM